MAGVEGCREKERGYNTKRKGKKSKRRKTIKEVKVAD